MRRATVFALAAILSAGVSVPVLAQLDHLGTVDFTQRDTHDSTNANIRSDNLALTARGADVYCDRVTARFGNGRMRDIFNGQIDRGQTVNVDLPGRDRNVDRVDFDCHPLDQWSARVEVAANIDRDANSPFFDRFFDRR